MKLYNLRTNKVIYRRNVVFNERAFPARTDDSIRQAIGQPNIEESGEELIGQDFTDEGDTFTITDVGTDKGIQVAHYQDANGKE